MAGDGSPRRWRRSSGAEQQPLSRLWWAASLPILLFLTLPLLLLLLRTSPEQLAHSLSNELTRTAIRLSLVTSTASMLLTVLFGTPLAYLMARGRFRGRRLVETLVELPMVLPPAVAGVALLIAFGRRGLIGGLLEGAGVSIAFTTTAVILAQIFIAAPFFIRSAATGFASIPADLEHAAALDGAEPLQTFRHVSIPLARRAFLAGATLTWARALGEFGATIIFAGNFPGRTQTMPLAIYLGFEMNMETALTLSVILLGISFTAITLVRVVFEREDL